MASEPYNPPLMLSRVEIGAAGLMPCDEALTSGLMLDLATLFTKYSPYVAAIGLRLLGRDEEVDDLVQDVFIAAERGLGRIREPGAVKGWLATITVREATRRLRMRQLRRWVRIDQAPNYAEIAAPETPPEIRILLGRVYAVLDSLAPRLRVPWSLRYLEGQDLAEVALHCGCSLATAKRRIAAAHQMVREALK